MKFFLFIKYYRMIEYSTLDEAYGILKKKKKETVIQEPLTDYTGKSDCYYKNKYNLNLDSCESFDNKKKPCEPIQPPMYEIPAGNETKKSLDATYSNLVNTKNNKVDDYLNPNYDVKPYYNDEIDMYLSYNEEKTTKEIREPFVSSQPAPVPPPQAPLPVQSPPNNYNLYPILNDYELCKKLKSFRKYFNENEKPVPPPPQPQQKPLPVPPPPQPQKPPQPLPVPQPPHQVDRDLLINLLLFIFIGIVIILLCDQIANLAINIGIKRTLEKMNISE